MSADKEQIAALNEAKNLIERMLVGGLDKVEIYHTIEDAAEAILKTSITISEIDEGVDNESW